MQRDWLSSAAKRYDVCNRATLEFILSRAPLKGAFVDTRSIRLPVKSTMAPVGYGAEFTFGWIQGRALEALMTFAASIMTVIQIFHAGLSTGQGFSSTGWMHCSSATDMCISSMTGTFSLFAQQLTAPSVNRPTGIFSPIRTRSPRKAFSRLRGYSPRTGPHYISTIFFRSLRRWRRGASR